MGAPKVCPTRITRSAGINLATYAQNTGKYFLHVNDVDQCQRWGLPALWAHAETFISHARGRSVNR
jgi:hypothetical protein